MDCYLCDKEATGRCPRCGNSFCQDHGEDPAGSGHPLCADCLDPVSATPSGTFFRGSLLALLLGSVLALWLLIRPPGLPGESTGVLAPDSSPLPVSPMESPVLDATVEPTPQESPEPTPSPEPSPSPTPEPSPEPTPIEYVVQEGETVFDIAQAFGVSFLDLLAVNGLTEEEAELLQPGDVLIIPQ